jgi:hypothetical protein
MKHLLFAFIIVVLIAASATAAQQSEQPSGSIKGRINVDGKAQPGVVVSLFRAEDLYFGRRSLATSVTDAEGRYRFTGVAAGRYTVSTSAPLFVDPEIDHNGQSGRLVTLDSNEDVEEIDFALARGGVITGRVTDSEGQPVISLPVMLLKVVDGRPGQGYRTSDLQMMSTDDRGIYRIYGVLPGRYVVKVGSPSNINRATTGGGRYPSYAETYHPDTKDYSKASIVEVTAGGEASGIDIKVGMIKKVYTATGRMVDGETGKPVPNNWYGISLGKSGRPVMMGNNRTNANGEFKIELAEPARVTIYPSSNGENNLAGEPFSFDLTSEKVTGLEIKLRRAQTISGVIIAEESNSAGVAPKFSGLRLTARLISPGSSPYNNLSVKIREDGSFIVGGIVAGKALFYISASEPGARRPWLVRVERNGVDQSQGIEIAEGESISDLRLVVAYGNAVVRGQVKIEGGSLGATKLYVSFRHTSTTTLFGGADLDARGRFVIEGLPDGEYHLTVGPARDLPGDDAGRDLIARMRAAGQTVTVTNGAETMVTLLIDLSEKK